MRLLFFWQYKFHAANKFLFLLLFIFFITSTSTSIFGQSISMKSIAILEGKVVLKFTLEDSNPERRYTLRLYSSLDNYVQPLQHVSGSIGVDQRVGGNKEIIWDATKELKSGFNDYISFELRAFIYIPFIDIGDLSQYGAFKRGKAYTLKWSGGRGDNVLNFELYKGEQKTGTLFKDIANTGSWPMTLPKSTKPGRDYYFKITDQNNSDEEVFTDPFVVKAQIPLIAKIAGGAGIAATGVILYNLLKLKEIPPPNSPN